MYYFFNTVIFLTHLLLLGWILFVLRNSGNWQMLHVFYHFLGLAIYGTLLIVISAKGIKYFHIKELKQKTLRK